MWGWSQRRTAISLAAIVVAISSTALADDPVAPPKPLAESLTGPAHTDYEVGRVLFKDGDFAGALAKFQAAYDKSKDARLLYNLAACERSLHHYARTVRLLVQYKEEQAADQLTDEDRAEANTMLSALKQYVAPLRVTMAEADASVYINDELVGTTPLASAVLVDFGKVTLRITKPGFADHREDVEVKDQGEIVRTVTLEKPEGRVVIRSRDDATIDIDGKFISRGRLVATLPFGGHQLKVTALGYRAYQTDLMVGAQERSLEIALEKEKSGGVPVWAWIGGSAVVVAGIAVGSYFVVRAVTSAPNGFTPVPGTVGGVQLQQFHW
jgi:hypothetical protein